MAFLSQILSLPPFVTALELGVVMQLHTQKQKYFQMERRRRIEIEFERVEYQLSSIF